MNQPAPAQPTETPVQEGAQTDASHVGETLADIEKEVDSPHVHQDNTDTGATPPDLDSARDEVTKAIDSAPPPLPEPVQALNAQPIDLGGADLPEPVAAPAAEQPFDVTATPDTQPPAGPVAGSWRYNTTAGQPGTADLDL
jgi:hypothetical protein